VFTEHLEHPEYPPLVMDYRQKREIRLKQLCVTILIIHSRKH